MSKKNKRAETAELIEIPRAGKKVFVSLQAKLMIGFTLLFSLVFISSFYWFYDYATKSALARIQEDLLNTLEGGALAVDGDLMLALAADGQPNAAGQAWLEVAIAEDQETPDAAALREQAQAQYGQATAVGFSEDPRYQTLMDQLQAIHNIEPRAWPYLYVRAAGEREITYVADLYARYDPSKAAPLQFTRSSRRSYTGLSELTLRLDDKNKFTPYQDDFGSWISAYRPVLVSGQAGLAGIGIDFEAVYVNQIKTAIRDRVMVAFAITYVIGMILVYLISRTLTRPILTLTKTARLIGDGEYDKGIYDLQTGAISRMRDEIVSLAEVFLMMTNKVYEREQSLRRQVESLQVFVDEAKRASQVKEIAETDFFKDLQAKARDLRKRKSDDEQ